MIVDMHVHCPLTGFGFDDPQRLLARARRFGIGKLVLLGDVIRHGLHPKARQVSAINDITYDLMRGHPDALVGFCFINPCLDGQACLREIDRCVEGRGFRGIKLLCSIRCRDAAVDPVFKRATELGVPVLQHAWYNVLGNGSGESCPADVADLAARFPKARIIMAHMGGAGVRGISEIAPFPNVSVDTSGSQPGTGLVEYAVERLGAERVVYASDIPCRDFSSQLGRIYGARISAPDRRKILGENALRLLGMN